jgi:glycerol uptake facilitator-like aquaporin
MPGLLQSPEGNFGSAKVIYALIAEFLGTMLFTFAGTATPTGNVSTQKSDLTDTTTAAGGSANWAPW